jgi:hypothetical protein
MGWWCLKWVHDQTQSPRLGRFHLDAGEIKDLLGRTRQGPPWTTSSSYAERELGQSALLIRSPQRSAALRS